MATVILALSCGLLVAGCDSPARAPEDAASRSLEGASEVLRLPPESIHTLGSSESLAAIRDLQPLRGGSIWALNIFDPYFIEVEGPESPGRAWGIRGEGPEEFQSPVAFVTSYDSDEVWVYDQRRHALFEVAHEDGVWREILLDREVLAPGRLVTTGVNAGRPVITRVGDEIFFGRESARGGTSTEQWSAEIIALDMEGMGFRTVLSIPETLGDPTPRFGEGVEFAPFPVWAVCPDASITLFDPLEYELSRHADGTSVPLPAALPPSPAIAVTPERLFALVWSQISAALEGQPDLPIDSATLWRELNAEIRSEAESLGSVFPDYTDLQCSDDGTLWMQPFDLEEGLFGQGPVWLRIPASGGPVTRIRLPNGFTPYRFSTDRIWGTVLDEFDVPSVAWVDTPEG